MRGTLRLKGVELWLRERVGVYVMERVQVRAREPVAVAVSLPVIVLRERVQVHEADEVPVPVLSLVRVGGEHDCVRVALILKDWVPVGQLQLSLGVRDWETWLYVAVDLVRVSDSLQLTVTVSETEAGDGVRVGANVWEALCVRDGVERQEAELEMLVAEWLAVAVELSVTVLDITAVSVLGELEPVVEVLWLGVVLLL